MLVATWSNFPFSFYKVGAENEQKNVVHAQKQQTQKCQQQPKEDRVTSSDTHP